MKGLSLRQVKQFEEIVLKVKETEEDLGKHLYDLQERVEKEWNFIIVPKVEALNEARERAETFLEAVRESMETYLDERSEAWLIGEAGEAFREWQSEWGVELPEIALDEPIVPTLEECDLLSETLGELPERVEA